VTFSDFPLPDHSAPRERVNAVTRPSAPSEKTAAAAVKAFGVVAVEGDSVSAAEIALGLKRLAEHVAGKDRSLQMPAVKLVRKEWQHMARFGSLKDRNSFLFGRLLAKDGLDSPYGRSLVARMKHNLESETSTRDDASTTASSTDLIRELTSSSIATASSIFFMPTVTPPSNDEFERSDSHESTSSTSSKFRKLEIV
jgi:hypothetical protein